ncbi:TetR family transcriptional regulator [Actinocorallia herbida]|uniref:TetR family transcriptional regulator n=1 Tax=Actinocorallia herbida TaxID=58109 RepID=A0A3N1CY04_9ACTN|nr:TetR/AcrR family transcriptional regulator [Actinocorallia herbida]ROO86151.1 TetR family transcriptional regulator [Actinocorallia herbida]
MGTRRRMAPEERRAQLLDIGAAMFAAQPYDEVLIERVAEQAQVSRALLYRYFPTKRDFFAAIFQRDSDALLSAATPDPGLPLADQVAAGLDAHIDYFVDNTHAALAVNRGPLSGDPLIQGIISTELATLRRRMIDATALEGHARALASTALHGWLMFVRGACTEWVHTRSITRPELHRMCLRTLASALGPDLLDELTGSAEENRDR